MVGHEVRGSNIELWRIFDIFIGLMDAVICALSLGILQSRRVKRVADVSFGCGRLNAG